MVNVVTPEQEYWRFEKRLYSQHRLQHFGQKEIIPQLTHG
jgi:hypothetical protein